MTGIELATVRSEGRAHVNQTQWSQHRSASIREQSLFIVLWRKTVFSFRSYRCLLFQVIKIYKNPDENPLRAGRTTQTLLAGKRLRQSVAVDNTMEDENLKVG